MNASNLQQPIRRICVVGGGTAGWMTAAHLRRRTNCEVILVEADSVAPVGVGEATIPALVDWLANMGLDEDDFLRSCKATYKLAIRFQNWIEGDDAYWHPFGLCGGTIDDLDLFHYWRRLIHSGAIHPETPYSHYSLQTLLSEQGKAHRPIGQKSVVENYAYHLDAGAFADYLKQVGLASGVRHHVAEVQQVNLSPEGHIQSVTCGSGELIAAEFFVDCTGFRSLLIEGTLQDPYIDWSDLLLCDRAVVTRLPAQSHLSPYTISTALNAGWAWQIPLTDRIGSGYVYSSRHISDEAARAELLEHVNQSADHETRLLKMRVGRRQNFWVKNCLSVGLSAGFVEPLESTGIFLIQRALDEWIECFPRTDCPQSLLSIYNARMSDVYDEVRDFIILHYIMSKRSDTAFWRDSRSVKRPESLQKWLQLYQDTGIAKEADRDPVFRQTNFYHILASGGLFPAQPMARSDFADQQAIVELLDRISFQNQQIAETLPQHEALLASIHSPMLAASQGTNWP